MKNIKSAVLLIFVVLLLAVPVHAKTLTVNLKKNRVASTVIVGSKITLKLKYGNKTVKASKVKLSSSKKKVATISKKGIITAKKVGKTTITVKYKGKKTKLALTVVKPVRKVSIDNKHNFTLTVGEKALLTATVFPSNATNKTLSWSSSNKAVASVSNGIVKGLKAGTAKITVKNSQSGKKDSCMVTVAGIRSSSVNTDNATEPDSNGESTKDNEETLYFNGIPFTKPAIADGITFWFMEYANNDIEIYSPQKYDHAKFSYKINNGIVQFLGKDEPYTELDGTTCIPFHNEHYVVPNMKNPIAFVSIDNPARERGIEEIHGLSISPVQDKKDLPVEIYYDGVLIYKTIIKTNDKATSTLSIDANGNAKEVMEYNSFHNNLNYCKKVVSGFTVPNGLKSFNDEIGAFQSYIFDNYTYDEVDCKVGSMLVYYYASYHGYKARYYFFEYRDAFCYDFLGMGLFGHTGCEVLINNTWYGFQTDGHR